MTESGVTFDPVQLVMDDEWIAMIRFVQRGFKVDAASLMVDDITTVGPFGDFLSLPSTLERMRDQSAPTLMDRRVYEEWLDDGGTDMYTRAAMRTRTILEEHSRTPLDDEVIQRLRSIVARADKERG
jgi:trimethylamine--corrinoid protein Co-methyltransferase